MVNGIIIVLLHTRVGHLEVDIHVHVFILVYWLVHR